MKTSRRTFLMQSGMAAAATSRSAAHSACSSAARSMPGVRFAVVAFEPAAGGLDLRVNGTRASVAAPKAETLHLRLFVDTSVLEVFANRTTSITERIYRAPQGVLRLSVSDLACLRSLDLWPIQPISQDRLTS